MPTDLALLLDRVTTLAAEQADGTPERLLERMEHTLTDGYALALGLEAKSLRIEREIGDALASGDANGSSQGLSELADRLASTQGELVSLRDHLDSLKRRADAVRHATVAA